MITVVRYKAVIGSITGAINAQKALASVHIPSEIVKTSTGSRSSGCVYGIEFSSEQYNNVRRVLDGASIKVREYITDQR
jgi:hypothetical protein